MIPLNITREHILRALDKIKKEGFPEGRSSRKFNLVLQGKRYPPKYVISIANYFANGRELESSLFSGGNESNRFLTRLGFEIEGIEGCEILSRANQKPHKKNEHQRKTESKHTERCAFCKKNVKILLAKLYGDVSLNYKFDVGTRPEDYESSGVFTSLKKIFLELQNYRGHKDFIKAKTLPHCDFFIKNPGFILEFDESQHFTGQRGLCLRNYPDDLKIGFPKAKWIRLCDEINARDNDPPYRDEQRAWYDSLRDFLPLKKNFIRL